MLAILCSHITNYINIIAQKIKHKYCLWFSKKFTLSFGFIIRYIYYIFIHEASLILNMLELNAKHRNFNPKRGENIYYGLW